MTKMCNYDVPVLGKTAATVSPCEEATRSGKDFFLSEEKAQAAAAQTGTALKVKPLPYKKELLVLHSRSELDSGA